MLSPEQIETVKEQAYLGYPSQFDNVCKIYPLTIGEIIEIGNATFNGRLELLLLTEVKISSIIKEKTKEEFPIEQIKPLEYILQSTAMNDFLLLEIQNMISTLVKEEVLLLPQINSILVGDPKERRLINEKNFRNFQDILRIQYKKDFIEPPPENETAAQRKMRLLRERVAEAKKKKAEKDGKTTDFLTLLETAEIYGIDVKNRTVLALYNLIRRYQAKETWEQNLRALCAGADSSKMEMKYWGESLDE